MAMRMGARVTAPMRVAMMVAMIARVRMCTWPVMMALFPEDENVGLPGRTKISSDINSHWCRTRERQVSRRPIGHDLFMRKKTDRETYRAGLGTSELER